MHYGIIGSFLCMWASTVAVASAGSISDKTSVELPTVAFLGAIGATLILGWRVGGMYRGLADRIEELSRRVERLPCRDCEKDE